MLDGASDYIQAITISAITISAQGTLAPMLDGASDFAADVCPCRVWACMPTAITAMIVQVEVAVIL